MKYARYLDSRLKNSDPTAHGADRLVLLGSPPDTVHGTPLRGTGLSSLLIQGRRHITRPGAGIHPRCSGLRVQGTAISPTSAALLRAEAEQRYYVFYYIRGNLSMKNLKGGKQRREPGRMPLFKADCTKNKARRTEIPL